MTLYMEKFLFPKLLDKEDSEVIHYLQNNSKLLDFGANCLDKQTRSKDLLCVTGENFAKYWIKNQQDSENLTVLKIVYPTIVADFYAYAYRKGSPFVKKFDKKFLQLLDTGIQKTFKHGRRVRTISKKRELDYSHSTYSIQLCILSSMGFFISILVFI